jgi:uncharacterized membrane protein
MDATRIHLFITHLPVFGLFLGFLVLVYGIMRHERQVKIVSLAVILISVVGGIIAFRTGESAEHTVENIGGVSEDAVEEHEESAEVTNLFFYGLGILCLCGLYSELNGKKYSKQLLLAVMAFTIVTFSFVVWTASLGGKIRHSEIENPNTNQSEVQNPEHK